MTGGIPVDFVVNCYARTFQEVLQPGYVRSLAEQQRHPFALLTVLVNNVPDRAEAERLAQECDVDRVVFVADFLDDALTRAHLKRRHLRPLEHFTDCCLVALALPGPDWLLYWDADARLAAAVDWISPSLEYAAGHPEIAVCNPNTWLGDLAIDEAIDVDNDFAVGYGFSDVAFLVRRTEFAKPIYRYVAPASWRYPLSHVTAIFEQRADAYMRRRNRLRATYLPVAVTHPSEVGANYPSVGFRGRLRRRARDGLVSVLSRVTNHPAVRAWPQLPPSIG